MSPTEFKNLLKLAGLNHSTAAPVLKVTRRTIINWAHGHFPINERNAVFIRTKLDGEKTAISA